MNTASNLPAICDASLIAGEAADACIVSTRPDGGVDITVPSRRCLHMLAFGGWLADVAERSGWTGSLDDLGRYLWLTQPARWMENGVDAYTAHRFVARLTVGGADPAESWGLLIDKDIPTENTGVEIWPRAALDFDPWFRDALRRAPEGGPIHIDMAAARLVHLRKAIVAAREHNATQELQPELWGHNGPQFLEIDYRGLRQACDGASDLATLRAVWPSGLPRADA
jgi:hypothetical protein